MNRLFFSTILACSIVLPLVLCGGCDETQEIVMTPEGTFTVSFLEGQEAGRQYAEEGLPAYVLVWRLYEVRTNLRGEFLDGFEAGLAKAGATASATAYRVVLQDAMSGNQFETARDLGAKHAAQAVTNEQIQGTIHSSLASLRASHWVGRPAISRGSLRGVSPIPPRPPASTRVG